MAFLFPDGILDIIEFKLDICDMFSAFICSGTIRRQEKSQRSEIEKTGLQIAKFNLNFNSSI